MVEWSLEETGRLMLFVLMIPLFLVIGGCVYNLFTNPPDAKTINNVKNLLNEIEFIAEETTEQKASETDIPLDISKGNILKVFSESEANPKKCNKRTCICIYDSPTAEEPKTCLSIKPARKIIFSHNQGEIIYPTVEKTGGVSGMKITSEKKENKAVITLKHYEVKKDD